MDCYIGIDLGSTTTKAVIIDENQRILGYGITNSRSNYDVASAVAKQDAFTNMRFRLLSDRLEAAGVMTKEEIVALERDLSSCYRHECFLGALTRLERHCRSDAASGRFSEIEDDLNKALDTIFAAVRVEADEIFAPGTKARSDFFRDIAGAAYVKAASAVSRAGGPSFDKLIVLYDKSIIPVENESEERSFEELIMAAFARLKEKIALPAEEVAAILKEVAAIQINPVRLVGTGYGRVRLPFPKDCIRSEILCHGLGGHIMFPGTRTILDIGGQDTKAIQVDAFGVVESFQMNDRCAAGCGRYLGYIADEMSIGLHELGPMAMASSRKIKINSTCTVFAGAEFRDRLMAGDKREDIVAGLHRAIILRAMSLLARSGGIRNEFTFTGGVAKNVAAVRALGEVAKENYDVTTLNIAPDSIYTGALGAATFAFRDIEAGALVSAA